MNKALWEATLSASSTHCCTIYVHTSALVMRDSSRHFFLATIVYRRGSENVGLATARQKGVTAMTSCSCEKGGSCNGHKQYFDTISLYFWAAFSNTIDQ